MVFKGDPQKNPYVHYTYNLTKFNILADFLSAPLVSKKHFTLLSKLKPELPEIGGSDINDLYPTTTKL